MSSSEVSNALKAAISQHVVYATQEERGRDIDTLTADVARTRFENLAIEHRKDVLEGRKIIRVRFGMVLTSLTLGVIAVTCAVAMIFFSSGVIVAGGQTLAVVTGLMGMTTSFTQLDLAIGRFIEYHKEVRARLNRIDKLKNKITDIRALLDARIKDLEFLEPSDLKQSQCAEILVQVKKLNGFIHQIKEAVPARISSFPVFDPSPLLKFAGT